MHDDRRLTEARLQRVLGERVWPAIYTRSVPLEVARWDAPGEPVPAAEGIAADHVPARVGDAWGPAWGTTWFRLRGEVPREWAGLTVEAVVDLGFDSGMPGFQSEGLVHLPDGAVVKGLNPRNAWIPVGSPAGGGEAVEFHVEAAANPVILGNPPFRPTELGGGRGPADEPLYRLARADLAVFETAVWELAMDLDVAGGVMRSLDTGDPRRWELLRALERSLDALDLHDVPGSADRAREALAPALRSPAAASAHRVSAVGHAHIDSAWLWPVRETVRKVVRTSANAVALAEDHPGFVFAMSQAQQWAWLKEHRPDVFARVVRASEAGQFVPVGGMWVESDTNMPGSEALARQFSFGKRFFRDELGVDTQEVWLPDSFGYSAALPQLVRLSGSRWFLTQKISWSQTNAFPHHTFWWEGIDGTRVFTHFPPVDTYNSELTGSELAHASGNFRDKGGASRSLVPFGHGDGGGGPTREMLARARRTGDLEGSPRVEVEHPSEFFAKAHAEYPDAPVWLGELYLEFHRGTYTSQAATKQGNRRSEHLLREAELWAATAAVRTGAPYPYEALDRVWRTVLLNQFHDILPGSSIAWVHREAAESYAEAAAELHGIVAAAQGALAEDPGGSGGALVFNAAPHERDGVPAPGAAAASVDASDGGFTLDNGLLTVRVDGRGLVTSVLDRIAEREVLAPGSPGNLLQVHPDLPNQWDAWDVDAFYRNTVTDLTGADAVEALEPRPGGAAALRVARTFGASSVVQVLSLSPGARRLDVETVVHWHEREKFLKAAFPVDVRADESSSEIQFGHVRRPTHSNTSWDAAKFEICAHRWVHVGEPGYGVAVLNDSTYGHDVTRAVRGDGGTTTTVRLSLLRAPRFPDPETDQGEHRFRYALAPGATVEDAVREGYRINLPPREVPGGGAVEPLVRVDDPGVVVESVKLADDRSGDVVVRLYEARGGRARATVAPGFPFAGVRAVNLLEEEYEGAPGLDVRTASGDGGHGCVAFGLRPFQIVTLRFAR
ncbi:alpha-mannosidase [Nocardiopsis tropica]|uniref:Glycoside hydrolase family 38 C-terminal domain-containing protein n=1 Tax=Nocardiopsis tropica TaxID=109330 RepID=A0ABU7KV37_9ACTN|nr:glycoside hydrolase family 38 C-terminal domain-containing protein [Nocardiopsis umidischolae]MEE2053170.1 glycoside hydrolase family 38 C-terminal domain-containing protein [Nocardiopsis umidischolae]